MTTPPAPHADPPHGARFARGAGVPAWLAEIVADVVARVGGPAVRTDGAALSAVVTARTPSGFDVVLEATADAVTLRVWGLERRHALPCDAPGEPRTAAALAALADWLALLGGAPLVVHHQAGAACCWGLVDRDPVRADHPRWHPAPPPMRLVRLARRWRRQVRANALVDEATGRAILASAAAAAAAAATLPAADARREARAVA